MFKVLVPVDGSNSSNHAIQHLIRFAQKREAMDIQLLNVQEPVDGWEVRRFFARS